MKKKLLISTSVLFAFSIYGCSANPELNQINQFQPDLVQSQAANTKTVVFKRNNLPKVKSPDLNPNPKQFSVTLKKIASKNSSNPAVNQVYNILSSAIENLAQMDVSYGQTDGSDNYDHAKSMSEFVKNTNSTILGMSSDSSLQGVYNVVSILNLNYSYNNWKGNGKFSYKYTDQKFFTALTYKFLLDNYDGENFNLTIQKVAGHFAQLPSYTQDFKDACFYMYDSLKFMASKVPSLSYIYQQAEPNNESWQVYSTRLRNLLLQVSKMPTL